MDNKKRLALDVIGQLEDELEADPLNFSKWNKLLKQVQAKDKEEQVRKTFAKYLDVFRYDSKQWCNYINYEINRGDFDKVKELFGKCLAIVDNVELFRLYVSFVRRVNDVITGGEKARGTVINAFEYAINRVGIDILSGDLWNDYLDFLKNWTPSASWEQQQKVDLIRKVYKKLLVIPTEKIEQLWSVYTKWENEVNAATASRFIADKSSEFMEARSWNTEWHNVTGKQLRRDLVPMGLSNDSNNIVHNQLKLWYKWLDLEKKNGLQIKDEALLQQRIEYVYKQALIALPFVPELWYRYILFLGATPETNNSKIIDLLSAGLVLNPKSFLLSFQLSETHERDSNLTKATDCLNNLINSLTGEHESISKKIDALNEKSNKRAQEKKPVNNNDDDEDNDETRINPAFLLSEDDARILRRLKSRGHELARSITLVYTKLMMSLKRSSGIKEARQVFKQAKKFKALGHELYVENALMEYYSDNKKTATRVFELGLKTFASNGNFLLSYLEFLIMINEIESIKVLFETAISNLQGEIQVHEEDTNEKSAPPWIQEQIDEDVTEKKSFIKRLIKKYAKFATKFLDLDIVSSLASRYHEYFPEDDPLDLLSSRYAYDDVDLIKTYDLAQEDAEVEQPKKRRKTIPTKPANMPSKNETPTAPSSQPIQFIGQNIFNLLRTLPNASYFGDASEHVFNSRKLVELISTLDVPTD